MDYSEKLREHVGRRIAELRENAGFTQADVAEMVGTSTSNYQRIEHGTQNLTLTTMATIAEALHVGVVRFFEPLEKPARRRPGRPKKRAAKKNA